MKALPLVAVLVCLSVSGALAQTVIAPLARPDPAGIAVPDLNFTPTKSDIGNYDDYFYFHKDGVSYERAFADLDQCRQYGLVAQIGGTPPKFVPLGAAAVKDAPGPGMLDPTVNGIKPSLGGVIGYALVDIIVTNTLEELARSTRRRCMMWKGYSRYGATRALWKQIETGDDAEKLARLALIAAGPHPVAAALAP